MIAKNNGSGGAAPAATELWLDHLGELHTRLVRHFRRPEVGHRARRYLVGLLERVDRKNGWQMAEAMGEDGPQGVQRLLDGARWDADAVRDDLLRSYIFERLGDDESGVLIVDETGFPKKGDKSVGLARRYTGTAARRTENSQVGVFAVFYDASRKGAAFVDRA